MESNSFIFKFSKSKLALIFIIIVFISSIIAGNYLFSEYVPTYYLEATELDEKPEKYFPFSNLDSHGIQTIFNSNIGAEVGLEAFLEIDELMSEYKTINVEYANNYYELQFVAIDRFPPYPILWLCAFSFFISSALIIATLIIKFKIYFSKE